jgi:hypothetical protein
MEVYDYGRLNSIFFLTWSGTLLFELFYVKNRQRIDCLDTRCLD